MKAEHRKVATIRELCEEKALEILQEKEQEVIGSYQEHRYQNRPEPKGSGGDSSDK